MKFLLDENVDHRLAPYLNSLGHSNVTVIGGLPAEFTR